MPAKHDVIINTRNTWSKFSACFCFSTSIEEFLNSYFSVFFFFFWCVVDACAVAENEFDLPYESWMYTLILSCEKTNIDLMKIRLHSLFFRGIPSASGGNLETDTWSPTDKNNLTGQIRLLIDRKIYCRLKFRLNWNERCSFVTTTADETAPVAILAALADFFILPTIPIEG